MADSVKTHKDVRGLGVPGAVLTTQPPVSSSLLKPSETCIVLQTPDQAEADCAFRIESDVLRRIKTRAGTQSLDDYIWLNIVRPALYSHVY